MILQIGANTKIVIRHTLTKLPIFFSGNFGRNHLSIIKQQLLNDWFGILKSLVKSLRDLTSRNSVSRVQLEERYHYENLTAFGLGPPTLIEAERFKHRIPIH
jgi:hypothetical protein